jgi:hypothetical protein
MKKLHQRICVSIREDYNKETIKTLNNLLFFNDGEIKTNYFNFSLKDKYIILDYYLNCKKENMIIYIYEKINQTIFKRNQSELNMDFDGDANKKIKIFSTINLRYLTIKLNYCKINDNTIIYLKKLFSNALKELYLINNKISDLSVFSEKNVLTYLKILDLSHNNIENIDILFNCKLWNLDKLNLSYNKISNIATLESANFKYLKELNLSENNITNIEVFEKVKFENLETLKLNKNKASNIEVLENIKFKKIKELDLSQNNISTRNRRLLEIIKNKLNLSLNIWPKNDHLVFKNKE